MVEERRDGRPPIRPRILQGDAELIDRFDGDRDMSEYGESQEETPASDDFTGEVLGQATDSNKQQN